MGPALSTQLLNSSQISPGPTPISIQTRETSQINSVWSPTPLPSAQNHPWSPGPLDQMLFPPCGCKSWPSPEPFLELHLLPHALHPARSVLVSLPHLQEVWIAPPRGLCPCCSPGPVHPFFPPLCTGHFLLSLQISDYFLGGISCPSQRPLSLFFLLITRSLNWYPHRLDTQCVRADLVTTSLGQCLTTSRHRPH